MENGPDAGVGFRNGHWCTVRWMGRGDERHSCSFNAWIDWTGVRWTCLQSIGQANTMARHALETLARLLGELSHQPARLRRHWHDDDSDVITSSKIMTRSSSMRVAMGLERPFNATVDATFVDDSEQWDVMSTTGPCSPGDCVSACLHETFVW